MAGRRSTFAMPLLVLMLATPAGAGIRPYVRLDYGGGRFKMSEIDANIARDQKTITDGGLSASFRGIGAGVGSGASAGLWLFPAFRLGATYGYSKSYRENRVHEPGVLFYDDQIQFQLAEFGAEAAVRIERLAGFTLGGSVARSRAQLTEGFTVQQPGSDSFTDITGEGTKTTYGAFVGFDQTNSAGVAGYVRLGYAFRDLGSTPFSGTWSDGIDTYPVSGTTARQDFSGLYLRAGIGFDLVR